MSAAIPLVEDRRERGRARTAPLDPAAASSRSPDAAGATGLPSSPAPQPARLPARGPRDAAAEAMRKRRSAALEIALDRLDPASKARPEPAA